MTALVYKRNDEYLAIAYVINDAPRVGGNLTQELIVEFGDFAADVGCGVNRVGPSKISRATDLAFCLDSLAMWS